MKLLIFAGSTRQQSYNRQLAHAAAVLAAQQGADVTLLELSSLDIPMYNADQEAQGTPADVVWLKEILDAHPAWLICSPEYNGSYTGLLKNTIDWASSPIKSHPVWSAAEKPFQGKTVGLLSASNGGLGGIRGLHHLTSLLLNLKCWVSPYQFALAHAQHAFNSEGHLQQAADQTKVDAVIRQLLWAASRLSTTPQADS